MHIAAAPGDATGLYIVEKAGRVRVLRDGVLQPEPFLQVPGLFAEGEGGLLSIAFAPDYATSGLLYTYSSSADLHIEIAEYRRSAAIRTAPTRPAGVLLLRIPHPGQTNHWGGQLQFGPDGFLYAGTGDGGGANDPAENAENLGSLLGKLLRIDPRGGAPYAIPPGNPFGGVGGAQPEIWAFGLRNPWRFSFDRATGDLALARRRPGRLGGGRLRASRHRRGRVLRLGRVRGNDAGAVGAAAGAPHVPPVLVRPHSEGDCSITGGYVVRAPDLPSLGGRYVHADFCVGVVRSGAAPAGLGAGRRSDRRDCRQPVELRRGPRRLHLRRLAPGRRLPAEREPGARRALRAAAAAASRPGTGRRLRGSDPAPPAAPATRRRPRRRSSAARLRGRRTGA